MKKKAILISCLVFLFIVSTAFTQSITMMSPNGGENWQKETTHNITWNSSGVSGNVIIKLLKGGTMLGSIAWNVPNTGNYSWTINDIAGTPIQPGNDYTVLVRSFNDHSIQDESDADFTINSPSASCSINVITPTGGENWQKGTTHNVTWNSSGVTGNIIIKLMKGGTMLGSIAYNIANTGSYSWTINNIAGNPIAPGSDYKILVRSFDDHSIEDKSDSNFTISDQSACEINVFSPKATSNVYADHYFNIKWDPSKGPSYESVQITLYCVNCGPSGPVPHDYEKRMFQFIANPNNTGTYKWKVPKFLLNPGRPCPCYKIMVTFHHLPCYGYSEAFEVKEYSRIDVLRKRENFLSTHEGIKKYEFVRKIYLTFPTSGPRNSPWWTLNLEELIEKTKNNQKGKSQPFDIFLFKGGEMIRKLGSRGESGKIFWVVNINSNGIAKFKIGKVKSNRLINSGRSGYKLILKNTRTSQIIKEIPVSARN